MKRPFLPLSKCMNTEDYALLTPELLIVDRHNAAEGQDPARRWEYAMAHRAISEWVEAQQQADGWEEHPLRACDVGGAGSLFSLTLADVATDVDVVDPSVAPGCHMDHADKHRYESFATDLWQHAATQPHDQYDILTAISVLEHVENVRQFLRAARMLLRKGGLLFLTVDCWNHSGPDLAHFHWMRERIYTPDTLRALQQTCWDLGFVRFGRSDFQYHGDTVYNYAFSSLAMVKK